MAQETSNEAPNRVEEVNPSPNISKREVVYSSESQGAVFFKLLIHSTAMLSLPFLMFYFIKNYAEENYEIPNPKSSIYGTIGAVIVVQLIIASYVYQAFREEDTLKKNL